MKSCDNMREGCCSTCYDEGFQDGKHSMDDAITLLKTRRKQLEDHVAASDAVVKAVCSFLGLDQEGKFEYTKHPGSQDFLCLGEDYNKLMDTLKTIMRRKG